MVFAFGGLLIFRENSDPILWNSLGWKPNVPIRKRILHLDPLTHITTLLALTSMPGKARKRSNALYVGTKTGHVFSVIISDLDDPKAEEKLLDPKLEEKLVDSTAVQKILDIQVQRKPKTLCNIDRSSNDDQLLIAREAFQPI